MGIRTPNSKVITGDTVKIASAGFQKERRKSH